MNINRLVVYCFLLIFSLDFILPEIGLKTRLLGVIPDIVALFFALLIAFSVGIRKSFYLPLKYYLLFFLFVMTIICGALINNVQAGTVVAGMRIYLKYIPYFLLPIVCDFSADDVKKLSKTFLVVMMVQMPLAFYQKFVKYSVSASGDLIGGTFARAPILSLFLLSALAIMTAFLVSGRMSIKNYVVLAIIAFLPTAINETKATAALLPLAVIFPVVFAKNENSKIKYLIPICVGVSIFLVSFQIIYTKFYNPNFHVIDYFKSGKASSYLMKSNPFQGLNPDGEIQIGRVEAINLAYKNISKDFGTAFFGVGIGNASPSFIAKYDGQWLDKYERQGGYLNTVSHCLWELGLVGSAYILIFQLFIFNAAVKVSKYSSIFGTLSLGWVGVCVILFVANIYQNYFALDILTILYSFISGVIVSRTYSDSDEKAEAR